MTSERPTLSLTGDGSARVSWVKAPAGDIRATIEQVRRVVEEALRTHHRVEALVDLDDEASQRVATWAGMRREGVVRGFQAPPPHEADQPRDHVLYARLDTDPSVDQPGGFRSLLNSFLPRKRAISQLLLRDRADRVLLCQLTYKSDWDLPGGVVEVGESPRLALTREVCEELGLQMSAETCVLIDWLPPWGGWDDAVCLVFDGGVQDQNIIQDIVLQEREIKATEFCTPDQIATRCADFTARRIQSALHAIDTGVPLYTESGRQI